jgi:hypothetical protein
MDAKRISNTSVAILLALTTTASAGPMNFARSKLIAPQLAQTEPAYYGCHGYYGWVPDGTIAGATGGYPYFGWYGYPLAIPILRPSVSSFLRSLPSSTLSPLWSQTILRNRTESSQREGVASGREPAGNPCLCFPCASQSSFLGSSASH